MHTNKTFFASANTSEGFISYFDTIFDANTLKEIFIIKGGPGTGKSGFMKRIANLAEKKGHTVERFICSSDPTSLDGIIIEELGIAMVDGTPPHTFDPKYPGAVETIINTGLFWNRDVLFQNKNRIIPLIQEKNRAYKRAYQFLKASGEIAREIEQIGMLSLDTEKMNQCISRITNRIFKKSKKCQSKIRITTAIGKDGIISIDSFQNESKTIYIIEDRCHTSLNFLERLHEEGKKANQSMTVSYSCILPDKIDSIYFPDLDCCFCIGERNYEKEKNSKVYHYINMRRFVSDEILKSNRQKIRFGTRCIEMLLDGAIDAFSQASESHRLLEKIYISAMNFEHLETMSNEWINNIF